jgi:hypothetical protein
LYECNQKVSQSSICFIFFLKLSDYLIQNTQNLTSTKSHLATAMSPFFKPDNLSSEGLLREQQPKQVTTEIFTSGPASNFLELTTEKLSLTDKSLSNRFISELLADNSTATTLTTTTTRSNSSIVSDNDSIENSSTSVHNTKASKQRGNSNSLMKSTGGGIRVSGQKIEMPQLNNFFDHSAYLKKHEHGFRYVTVFF